MRKFKFPKPAGPAEARAQCKKLPLPRIFALRNHPLHGNDWLDVVGARVEPLFHKEGYYLRRHSGLTWVEFDDMAFLYRDRAAFGYELAISEGNNRLEDHIYKALGLLICERVIHWRGPNANLWHACQIEHQMRTLRHITVSSRLSASRMMREVASATGRLKPDAPQDQSNA